MFKTHPFNMTFEEIKKMRFKQMLILVDELKKFRQERANLVENTLKRNKEIMPTYDPTVGIYAQ